MSSPQNSNVGAAGEFVGQATGVEEKSAGGHGGTPTGTEYDNIPDFLKSWPNFLLWRLETTDKGKETKVPYSASTGWKAATDNPETWVDFNTAVRCAVKNPANTRVDATQGYSGIGIVLHGIQKNGQTLVGLDFDDLVHDGKLDPYPASILEIAGKPYCEITPSNTGARAFGFTDELPDGRRKFKGFGDVAMEIYAGNEGGRYFTLTGNYLSGSGIPVIDNIELVHLLMSQVKNQKFQKLWIGDTSDKNNDQSSADASLLVELAILTNGDAELMEEYFSQSALAQRDKWTDREDYRTRSIQAALMWWKQHYQTGGNGSSAGNGSANVGTAGTGSAGFRNTSIIKEAREAKARFLTTMKDTCVVDDKYIAKDDKYIFRGFLTANAFCVAIGREKSEKSLFWLRFAMHMACGKDFCGYHCEHPRRVGYLDAENGGDIMDFRRKVMLSEFSPEQQDLIKQNLVYFNAQMFDMDYLNEDAWALYFEKCGAVDVHVLDCLYKFHNLDSGKASTMGEVIEVLLYRAGYYSGKTVVLLNHTRGFSNDDLKKMQSLSLATLGVRAFAQLTSGSKNVTKLATLVTCQDLWIERDDEGEIELEQVHFQFFTRSGEESPLLKFDKTGDLERTIVRELTAKGREALHELVKSGQESWASKNDAAKVLTLSRSNANARITELVVKGYLVRGNDNQLHLTVTPSVARDLEKRLARDAKLKEAALWLKAYLSTPRPKSAVLTDGLVQGFTEDILLYAREALAAQREFTSDEDGTVVETWRLKKAPGIKRGSAVAAAVAAAGRKARAAKKVGTEEPVMGPIPEVGL